MEYKLPVKQNFDIMTDQLVQYWSLLFNKLVNKGFSRGEAIELIAAWIRRPK